jgi:hypothetical protein
MRYHTSLRLFKVKSIPGPTKLVRASQEFVFLIQCIQLYMESLYMLHVDSPQHITHSHISFLKDNGGILVFEAYSDAQPKKTRTPETPAR